MYKLTVDVSLIPSLVNKLYIFNCSLVVFFLCLFCCDAHRYVYDLMHAWYVCVRERETHTHTFKRGQFIFRCKHIYFKLGRNNQSWFSQ